MAEPLIRARNITKVFDRPGHPMRRFWRDVSGGAAGPAWHTALEGVDLDVFPGETVGVLGRNGAGKSTLLAILAGIQTPTSGTVERRGRIVPILELGGSFDDNRSGHENVIDFARAFGVGRNELQRVLTETQTFAEVGEAFNQPMRTLSSGTRARVAFAAAMALRGDLVILDETLAVGDLSFRIKCYDTIRKLHQLGTAFLLVSHNQNTLANLCTRMIVINGARVVFDGHPTGAVGAYKAMRLAKAGELRDTLHGAVIRVIGAGDIDMAENERVVLRIRITPHRTINDARLNVGLLRDDGVAIAAIATNAGDLGTFEAGNDYDVDVRFINWIAGGAYSLTGYVSEGRGDDVVPVAYNPQLARLISRGREADDAMAHVRHAARIERTTKAS